MTTARKPSGTIVNPEPFTIRDVLVFSITGLALFSAMFAFMFSLSSM